MRCMTGPLPLQNYLFIELIKLIQPQQLLQPPMCVCMLSHFSRVHLFVALTPCSVADQVSMSRGFSRQEHWSGLLCPRPGRLPDPGIEPISLMFPAWAPPGKPFHFLDSVRIQKTWILTTALPPVGCGLEETHQLLGSPCPPFQTQLSSSSLRPFQFWCSVIYNPSSIFFFLNRIILEVLLVSSKSSIWGRQQACGG